MCTVAHPVIMERPLHYRRSVMRVQMAANPRLVTILKSPSVIPQAVKTQRGIIRLHQIVITRDNK